MRIVRIACAVACLAAQAAAQQGLLTAPERAPIVGANTPALSPDGATICFSYRGDLWTVPTAGGTATRLTVHPAHDAYPRWSPDGKWIAFASNRFPGSSLNYDVFVMPSLGGEPRRLTYHTNNDYPFDWSPDGKRLLLQAIRSASGWQAIELTLDGVPTTRALTDDRNLIRYPVYAPDGRSIAYNRAGRTAAWWRPRYRGSANMDIWLRPVGAGAATRLTSYDGSDLWPMFAPDGRSVYYVSDVLTPGVPNLVMAAISDRKPVSVTRHREGAVTWPNMARDGSAVVYIRAGEIFVWSVRDRTEKKPVIYADSDIKQNRTERLAMAGDATELEASPDGKTLGLVVRGELWTIPADKGGEATRLTETSAHDHDFVWSRDGSQIAFVSDRDGLYGLYALDVAKKSVRKLAGGDGDVSSPQWSPDGRLVAFLLSGPQGGLYVVASDGKEPARRVTASEGNNRFGVGIGGHAWSPDSKWMAFSRRDTRNGTDVWVVPAAGGDPVNVTSYPGSNDNPRWSADGKYLTFTSSRDRPVGEDLYALELQRSGTPAVPEAGGAGDSEDAAPRSDWANAAPDVKIDFAEIEQRARRLTTMGLSAYDLTPDGKQAVGVASFGAGSDHFMVPLASGPVQRLTNTGDVAGVPRYGASTDRYWSLARGGGVRTYQRAGPGWSGAPLAFEARMELDRVAERRQVFMEFWRSVATGFYDPAMHGVDWQAMRDRYVRLLDGTATAEEFAFFVLAPLAGELNASHIEVSPPAGGPEPETASLGLAFDETYAGPGLKVKGYVRDGPNGSSTPTIKPGEFILSIGGVDVAWNEMLWNALSGRADKDTELVVNTKPDREGSRIVKLKPVSAQRMQDLEYEQEVREAREQTDKLSGGKAAYVRIRSMDGPSLRRMERELWGMAQAKSGLILDIRGNGGGSTHDAILAQLARTSYGYTQPRDGARSSQPWRHWNKPIVLMVDENSASDSEILAMGFRHLKLGKIVGERTPGYVIGTYSATLQDGTSYRVPMWRWLSAQGGDLENVGVAPDVTVERTGTDAASDEQLRAAVMLLLKELPKE